MSSFDNKLMEDTIMTEREFEKMMGFDCDSDEREYSFDTDDTDDYTDIMDEGLEVY